MIISKRIEPIVTQAGVVGFIEEIHGEAGKSDCIEVTRFEICLLARHWIEQLKSVHHTFAMGGSGSWEIRMRPYAEQLIAGFIEAEMISVEKVNEIAKEMYGPKLYEKWWPVWKETKDQGPKQPDSSQIRDSFQEGGP